MLAETVTAAGPYITRRSALNYTKRPKRRCQIHNQLTTRCAADGAQSGAGRMARSWLHSECRSPVQNASSPSGAAPRARRPNLPRRTPGLVRRRNPCLRTVHGGQGDVNPVYLPRRAHRSLDSNPVSTRPRPGNAGQVMHSSAPAKCWCRLRCSDSRCRQCAGKQPGWEIDRAGGRNKEVIFDRSGGVDHSKVWPDMGCRPG